MQYHIIIFKSLFVIVASICLVKFAEIDVSSVASCTCNPNVCTAYDKIKNEVVNINVTKCYDEQVMYAPGRIINMSPIKHDVINFLIYMIFSYIIITACEMIHSLIYYIEYRIRISMFLNRQVYMDN